MTSALRTTEPLLPADDARRAIARMRRYTTWSLVAVVVFYVLMTLTVAEYTAVRIALIVAAVPLVALMFFWESSAPRWVAAMAIGAGTVVWSLTLSLQDNPVVGLGLGTALGVILTQAPRLSVARLAVGSLPLLLPLGVALLVVSEVRERAALYTGVTVALYAVAVAVFVLNRYQWDRYLEIDAARRTGAELAVMQERFRFAADLHDIQGHSLHLLRLKTQLADRLIDRDPAAAHGHLAEALELIGDTLANTRSLAFGERHVAVASELANAQGLFDAAGISCSVRGSFPAHPNEELFGLVVREATTNILRHAQATEVTVRLGSGSIVLSNNGAPVAPRPLSGLARLGERFEAIGGTLRTASVNGTFSTEARVHDESTGQAQRDVESEAAR